MLEELHTGSDHSTLMTEVPTRTREPARIPRLIVHDDRLADFRQIVKRQAHTVVVDPTSVRGLEIATKTLLELLQVAIEAVRTRTAVRGKLVIWWNDDCKAAVQVYQEARRIEEGTQEARKRLRDTVRKTKRKY